MSVQSFFERQTVNEEVNYITTAISGENLGAGDGTTTSFSGTVASPPVKADTFAVTFTYGGQAYTVTANAQGEINSHFGASNEENVTGTLVPSSGAWSLVFTAAPDNGTNITADYEQINNLQKIYTLEADLSITSQWGREFIAWYLDYEEAGGETGVQWQAQISPDNETWFDVYDIRIGATVTATGTLTVGDKEIYTNEILPKEKYGRLVLTLSGGAVVDFTPGVIKAGMRSSG